MSVETPSGSSNTEVLDKPISIYMKLLPEMLENHNNEWVIIPLDQDEPLGFFTNEQDAINSGFKKCKDTPFLARQVNRIYLYGKFGPPRLLFHRLS